jgi:hypothetical protein
MLGRYFLVCIGLAAMSDVFAGTHAVQSLLPGYVLLWSDEFNSLSLDEGYGSATWSDHAMWVPWWCADEADGESRL